LLRKSLSRIVVVGLLVGLLSGFAVSLSAADTKIELEVACIDVGYGLGWLKQIGAEFEKVYPDVTVKVWGNPRLWDQMQPRFVAGNPPDVVAPGWKFDFWGAVYEGRIKRLNDDLETLAFDEPVAWKDTFAPGSFKSLQYEGNTYMVPTFVDYYGIWYDQTLWNKHGWEVPSTWEEAFVIFEEMKAEGIAPIANQGTFPLYIDFSYLPVLIAQKGGPQALEDCINLKPGAWNSPEVVEAVTFLKYLIDNYFQEGHLGMNHLQAQAELMVGHAGVIVNGTWFPNEVKEIWPEGVELRCMPYPGFAGSDLPQVGEASGCTSYFFVVPTDAKHPELGVRFLQFLTSRRMSEIMTRETGGALARKGSDEWLPDDKIGRGVWSAVQATSEAEVIFDWAAGMQSWYSTFSSLRWDMIALLEQGEITPEEFCQRAEQKAQEVREDPDWPVHEYKITIVGSE
jgi:N-acetylglucosamine transport system substrate-binding protein